MTAPGIRVRIVVTHSDLSSIKMADRPSRKAASPVVPLPAVQSSTTSPGFE